MLFRELKRVQMNIEKIYSALETDQMNSGIGIVCLELENQGYEVEIENILVSSAEIFENRFPSLEEVAEPLNLALFKNGMEAQKFSINFIDYHKIIFRKWEGKTFRQRRLN